MNYKINSIELFGNISLLDFYTYVDYISTELEEQNKNKSTSDFHKALINIRDILNFVYPK